MSDEITLPGYEYTTNDGTEVIAVIDSEIPEAFWTDYRAAFCVSKRETVDSPWIYYDYPARSLYFKTWPQKHSGDCRKEGATGLRLGIIPKRYLPQQNEYGEIFP